MMKVIFCSFFILIFCGNSLVSQNYYYSLGKPEETVPQNATEISNVSELISGLKSGANLYLNAGNYNLSTTLYLYNLSNVTVTGENGAVITGDLVTLIQFKGSTNGITFNNIGFNSTSSYTAVDDGAGIVYFDGGAEDILFENCEFTCPKVVSNGLKFSAYPASRTKNITIHKCNFFDIGRMAIETTNHNSDENFRITDIKVTECKFERLGLQSPYGMAVSLSGTGRNAIISNNTIVDAKDRGIENVAWNNVVIKDNTFSFKENAYHPITINRRAGGSQYMTGVSVIGNTGTVSGNDPHLIELWNCDGLEYSKNSFYADALHLNDVKNSSFTNNFHSSDGGIGLYVENKSNNNTFYDNTLTSIRDYAVTISFFSSATGNILNRNEVIKLGIGGAKYVDEDGGNINLDLPY